MEIQPMSVSLPLFALHIVLLYLRDYLKQLYYSHPCRMEGQTDFRTAGWASMNKPPYTHTLAPKALQDTNVQ